MASTVKIEGLKELQAALSRLPRELDRKVLNAALMAGARPMVAAIKARAPVDTGTLARNIRARPVRPYPGNTATVEIGVRRLNKRQVNLLREKARKAGQSTRVNAWYWRFLEFGTSKMTARPFLRPGFEAEKIGAIETIKTALARRIEREATRLGGRRLGY